MTEHDKALEAAKNAVREVLDRSISVMSYDHDFVDETVTAAITAYHAALEGQGKSGELKTAILKQHAAIMPYLHPSNRVTPFGVGRLLDEISISLLKCASFIDKTNATLLTRLAELARERDGLKRLYEDHSSTAQDLLLRLTTKAAEAERLRAENAELKARVTTAADDILKSIDEFLVERGFGPDSPIRMRVNRALEQSHDR